jgi:hypothetical protein
LFVSERGAQMTRQAVNHLLARASARATLPPVNPLYPHHRAQVRGTVAVRASPASRSGNHEMSQTAVLHSFAVTGPPRRQ